MVSTGFVFSVMNGSLLVAILIGWGVSLLFRGAWAFGIGLASTLLVLFAIRRRVTLWAAQKADAMVKRARERQAVAEGGWYGYAPLFEGHTLPIVGPPKEEPNPPEDGPILTVPAVTGMAMADAAQILNQLGLRVEQSGSGTVQTVNPAEGTEVIFGSIVRLHGDDPRGQ
ncbi:MAG: PASTA domain-containing protein [Actinomycetota bacterium]